MRKSKRDEITPEMESEIGRLSKEDRDWYTHATSPNGGHSPIQALRFLNKIADKDDREH